MFMAEAKHNYPCFFTFKNLETVAAFDLCDILQWNWLNEVNFARQQRGKTCRCISDRCKGRLGDVVLNFSPPSSVWNQNRFHTGIAAR